MTKRTPGHGRSPFDKFGHQFSQRDLLGLAWVCEMAACWRKHIGDEKWSEQLFRDASKLRDAAVND